jgi:hypothetical protein
MKTYKDIWRKKAVAHDMIRSGAKTSDVHLRLKELFGESLTGKTLARIRHDCVDSAYRLAVKHRS